MYHIHCSGCDRTYDSVDSGLCAVCGQRVRVEYDGPAGRIENRGREDMWRYRAMLPVPPDLPPVSMGEGNTPLVRSCGIGPALGLEHLYFKLESCNPTGSFKDRIASLVATCYAAQGTKTLATITSGNAGSALAAYAARAGMQCVVLYMAEAPQSKRLALHAYGATVVVLNDVRAAPQNLDRAFEQYLEVGRAQGWPTIVMSHRYAPLYVEAYKTISFELCDQWPQRGPDCVYVPVGGGGLLAGMWKGFEEYRRFGHIADMPQMCTAEPAGAASIAQGFKQGKDDAIPVEPATAVSGAGGAYACDGPLILPALRSSGGHCTTPTDEQVYQAQFRLAREEGIFAEPAGALSVAGLIEDAKSGRVRTDQHIVCVITGSGFKDREAAEQLFVPKQTPQVQVGEIDKLVDIVANSDPEDIST